MNERTLTIAVKYNINQISIFYFSLDFIYSIKTKTDDMASGGSGSLKGVFDQYSRFGKTEAQLKDKEVRLESRNIQKMMKDCGVIDSKYTTQALDNDVARVLGQLTNGGTYPKGT